MPLGFQSVCALVLLFGGLLLSPGCAGVSSGYSDVLYYQYDYYPDWNVYYYTADHIYYWSENGNWYAGERLPSRYHGTPPRVQHLVLRTPEPWNENQGQGGNLSNGETSR